VFTIPRLSPKSSSGSHHARSSSDTVPGSSVTDMRVVQSWTESRCRRAAVAACLCYERVTEEALLCAALLPSAGATVQVDERLAALAARDADNNVVNSFHALLAVLSSFGVAPTETQHVLLERLHAFCQRVNGVLQTSVSLGARMTVSVRSWSNAVAPASTSRQSTSEDVEMTSADIAEKSSPGPAGQLAYSDVALLCGVCGQPYPTIFMCQSSTSPAAFRSGGAAESASPSQSSQAEVTSFRFSASQQNPAGSGSGSSASAAAAATASDGDTTGYIFCQRCHSRIILPQTLLEDRRNSSLRHFLPSPLTCSAKPTPYGTMLANALFVLDSLSADGRGSAASGGSRASDTMSFTPTIAYLDMRGVTDTRTGSLPFSRSSSLGDSLSDLNGTNSKASELGFVFVFKLG
jgi:hypothetical protein